MKGLSRVSRLQVSKFTHLRGQYQNSVEEKMVLDILLKNIFNSLKIKCLPYPELEGLF